MDLHEAACVALLDLRHLPAPEPLQQIERALARLPAEAVLQAHTPMLPSPLLARLEAAGWEYALRVLPDGSAIVAIRRPGPRATAR